MRGLRPLERKADSSLKDITTECRVQLGCDLGGKETEHILSK